MESKPDDFSKFFQKTCASLVKGQQVTTLDSECSIENACQVLADSKILSAPVYDKTKKCFVGTFDYSTLISYLFKVFETPEFNSLKTENDEMPSTLEVRDLIRTAMLKQNVPVGAVSSTIGFDFFNFRC